ncbi:MAG: NRDE family protein [Flavobacteriaceae bacterium]|nr:NRDE family protein [Flavobacteriaceae bacterium]
MCTVTYLPLNTSDFILTSSRDVPFARKKALHPKKYIEDGVEIYYPKDGKAGGTWIGTSSKKRLICLLNGGFEYHPSKSSYKKSRGLIVKELLKVNDIRKGLNAIDLIDVEQFILIIVDWNTTLELIEFVWDGQKKHIKILPQKPHIWSSSTLYDNSIKQMRKDWFIDWQKENEFSQEKILEFHHHAGIGDSNIDLIMDRGMGGTVSITSIKRENGYIIMSYESFFDKKISVLKFMGH